MFWDIFLPVSIFIFSAIATIIAWFGKTVDNRRSLLKRIMPIGWWVILFLGLGMIDTGIGSYYSAKSQKQLADSVYIIKRNSDSIKTANTAIKEMLNTLSIHSDEAGRLFISQLSSAEKNIKATVTDSVGYHYPHIEPYTGPLGPTERYIDTVSFLLRYDNNGNVPAENLIIKFNLISYSKGVYKLETHGSVFRPNQTIMPSRYEATEIFLEGKNIGVNDSLFVFAKGTYNYQNKVYILKEHVMVIDLKTKTIRELNYHFSQDMVDFLRKNHLIK